MDTINRSFACAALLAASLGLAACASRGQAQGDGPVFPDPASATLAGGTYPNLDNVRNLSAGMSKDQIYHLLGRPHFNEGVFGVREWDYLFRIRGPQGSVETCQYKILFDDSYRSSAMHWSPQSCAALLDPDTTPDTPVVREERTTLSADALFGFASAELSASGRLALDGIVAGLADRQVEQVSVIGHADRIGSDAANDALSQRRAEAVARYLAAKGVPAAKISSEGRGRREPVVECDDTARSQLIACLAPNRRVEVSMRAVATQ